MSITRACLLTVLVALAAAAPSGAVVGGEPVAPTEFSRRPLAAGWSPAVGRWRPGPDAGHCLNPKLRLHRVPRHPPGDRLCPAGTDAASRPAGVTLRDRSSCAGSVRRRSPPERRRRCGLPPRWRANGARRMLGRASRLVRAPIVACAGLVVAGQRQNRSAVLALAVARERARAQDAVRSRASRARSARGSVRFLPSMLSTVLPLTVRAWVASQPLPGDRRRGHRVGAEALDDDVVAGPAVEGVVAGAAEEHVVARAAEQRVVAVAADQDVVAVAAVEGEQHRAGGDAGGVDHVVAAPAR